MASKDFNYQVALKEGLKSLEQGRLRQAEQSFKYLVEKFPGAEGGYRGLAKVHFEQDDRGGALRVLRDGATALIKSGDRSAAIGLLRQAVTLDPRDLATHRRLAAALALAGDTDASVEEYARFIRDLRDSGESERAKNEVVWAKGQLRGVNGVSTLDAIANGTSSIADQPAEPEVPAEETTRFSDRESGTALRPQALDQWALPRTEPAQSFTPPPAPPIAAPADDPWATPPPVTSQRRNPSEQDVREITLENDPWATVPPPSASWMPRDEPSDEAVAHTGVEETVADEPAVDATAVEETPLEQMAGDETAAATAAEEPEPARDTWMAAPENGEPRADVDPVGVEAAAARYLATR